MNEKLELVHQQPKDLAVQESQPSEDPIGLLRLAITSGASPEALERMMAVRRELRAESAQAAFERALSSFQTECPVISKSIGVPTRTGEIAYKYAPLEEIERVIRPIEGKHGLNHTFDTDTSSAQGWVIVKCIITHRDGHSRSSTVKLPLGSKTNIMSDTQQFAAALTFANRRALQNAYGLVISGEDRDGADSQGKRQASVDPKAGELKQLAQELWVLLKPVRGSKPDWTEANQWLWRNDILDAAADESAPHLPIERMRQVIAEAKGKLSH